MKKQTYWGGFSSGMIFTMLVIMLYMIFNPWQEHCPECETSPHAINVYNEIARMEQEAYEARMVEIERKLAFEAEQNLKFSCWDILFDYPILIPEECEEYSYQIMYNKEDDYILHLDEFQNHFEDYGYNQWFNKTDFVKVYRVKY